MSIAANAALLPALRARGFAVRAVPATAQAVLSLALRGWAQRGTFRFPPAVEHAPPVAAWPHEFRASFRTLLGVAVGALTDLVDELERDRGLPPRLAAFNTALLSHSGTASHAGSTRAPMRSVPDSEKFETSFANFFNYDHGCVQHNTPAPTRPTPIAPATAHDFFPRTAYRRAC